MSNPPTLRDTPSGRAFVKMHGLLNHFVIVDARDEPFRPDTAEIVRICDPRRGVGADQLIVIEPPTAAAGGATAFMRILNVDGREAEACGNATRCVAWLLLEELAAEQVVIETLAGLLACRRAGDGQVTCDMGRISTGWRSIPLAEERDTGNLDINGCPLRGGIALNIGNPHIVFFVDDVAAIDVEAFAPALQRDPLFPDQVNVGVASVAGDNHLRSVVYERGAGLTMACGSGACVAAFAARRLGLAGDGDVRVSMRAGDVTIAVSGDATVTMTGPVAYCFSGYL